MKLKKRYLAAPLAILLLTSPINFARYKPVKANYLENLVDNFSSFIYNKPIEIEEVSITHKLTKPIQIPEVSVYGEDPILKKDRKFQKKIQEQSSDEISTPYYRLKSNRCSQYALLSARKLFEKEYNWEDAWNLRYSNKVIHKFQKEDSMKDLIIDGKLDQGMLIGIDQPKSVYKNHKDKKGQTVKYTHAILYLGLRDDGRPEFVNQLGRRIERITDKDFAKKEFTPKEIIAPKNYYVLNN